MRELCVPIPISSDTQVAEVDVNLKDGSGSFHFRLESFGWDISSQTNEDDPITEKLMKIYNLKKAIEEYDNNWELIQIFTPPANSKSIQVLFRKKRDNISK